MSKSPGSRRRSRFPTSISADLGAFMSGVPAPACRGTAPTPHRLDKNPDLTFTRNPVPGLPPSSNLAADAGDGLGRIDDRDTGMATEGKEVGIAGDDQIGL